MSRTIKLELSLEEVHEIHMSVFDRRERALDRSKEHPSSPITHRYAQIAKTLGIIQVKIENQIADQPPKPEETKDA